MKVKDLLKKNIVSEATIMDMDIPLTKAIKTEAFRGLKTGDYKERTIQRLVAGKEIIESDCDLIHLLVERLISVTCPYCKGKMKLEKGNGDLHFETITWSCEKCKAEVDISFPTDGIRCRIKGG
jgi:hypothetical protein